MTDPPLHVPRRRPAGGHARRRPKNWVPADEDLELLWSDNRQDLQLYEYALGLVRARLDAAAPTLGALPPTPPTESVAAFREWLASRV